MKAYFNRLRELREDNDLTQKQVAAYLTTSQTMYARYERGANELPIHHLLKLCALYNISSDYILGIKRDTTQKEGRTSENIKRLLAQNDD